MSKQKAEAIVEELPQPQQQVSIEDLKKEVLASLGEEYLGSLKPKEVTSVETSKIPVKPRRIIYQIKGVKGEDAMFNGAHIPGKSMGVSSSKLSAKLVNRNDTPHKENTNYVTGLEVETIEANPYLPKDVKDQWISDVQTARAFLEFKYNASLSAKNYKFWDDYKFTVSDLSLIYDTDKITSDKKEDPLIAYFAIKAGGIPDIAPSFDQLNGRNYYLTVREEEVKRNFKKEREKIKAISKLDEIMDNWSKQDMIYLLYYLDGKSNRGFTLNTPTDLLVEELKDYIEGVDTATEKKQRPANFLEATKVFEDSFGKDKVKATALINAALYYGLIITTSKKELENRNTGFNYGSSMAGAIEKLLDPRNVEERSYVQQAIIAKWKI